MTHYINPGNTIRIERIITFVSVDKNGNEGILGMQLPNGNWLPMIEADDARIESYTPYAEQVARETGMQVSLIRFDNRTTLIEKL